MAAPFNTSRPLDHSIENVVSVLYHAQHNATFYERCLEEAEILGDDELVQFFEHTRDQEAERIERARALLAHRLGDRVLRGPADPEVMRDFENAAE